MINCKYNHRVFSDDPEYSESDILVFLYRMAHKYFGADMDILLKHSILLSEYFEYLKIKTDREYTVDELEDMENGLMPKESKDTMVSINCFICCLYSVRNTAV